MSQSKYNTVKDLLLRSNTTLDDHISGESSTIQLTYLNGLENDIKTTKSFLDQADKALKKLNLSDIENINDNNDNNTEIETKRRILALHETYSKLSYQPSKNDVIGIASASKIVNDLVEQYATTTNVLEDQRNKYDSDSAILESLISDYKDMISHLEVRIKNNPERLAELVQKTDQVRMKDLSVNSQIKSIDHKLSDSFRVDKLLSSHLQKVITKFLAFQDWSNETIVSEDLFKENILLSLNVIDRLVENLLDSIVLDDNELWLQIEPTASDESLIRILIRNDIAISREDSTSQVYYLKLRDYGIEF